MATQETAVQKARNVATEAANKGAVIQDRLKRYNEYSNYMSKKLINSYEQHIEVVINVSSIMNKYYDMIDEIIKNLESINTNLNEPLKVADLEDLKKATLENIDKLKKQYEAAVSNLDATNKVGFKAEAVTTSMADAAEAHKPNPNALKLPLSGGEKPKARCVRKGKKT